MFYSKSCEKWQSARIGNNFLYFGVVPSRWYNCSNWALPLPVCVAVGIRFRCPKAPLWPLSQTDPSIFFLTPRPFVTILPPNWFANTSFVYTFSLFFVGWVPLPQIKLVGTDTRNNPCLLETLPLHWCDSKLEIRPERHQTKSHERTRSKSIVLKGSRDWEKNGRKKEKYLYPVRPFLGTRFARLKQVTLQCWNYGWCHPNVLPSLKTTTYKLNSWVLKPLPIKTLMCAGQFLQIQWGYCSWRYPISDMWAEIQWTRVVSHLMSTYIHEAIRLHIGTGNWIDIWFVNQYGNARCICRWHRIKMVVPKWHSWNLAKNKAYPGHSRSIFQTFL